MEESIEELYEINRALGEENLALKWQVDRLTSDSAKLVEGKEALRTELRPWGSGGIITGTVLAWIAAKNPAIAKAIVNGKAAVDLALKN